MITPKVNENSSYRIMYFRSPYHLYDDHDAELLVSICNDAPPVLKSRFNILVTSST